MHPTAEAGCPGAWYRTPWFASVAKYYRRVTDNRDRVENPLLTNCDDPLIIEAIQTLESFEEAAHAEHMRLYYAQLKNKQKASR